MALVIASFIRGRVFGVGLSCRDGLSFALQVVPIEASLRAANA